MPVEFTYVAANTYSALELLAATVAILILISSIDDVFVDAWFWVYSIYRRFVVTPTHHALTVEQLYQRSEQPLAIMVPAWLEFDVIAAMIENMVQALDYHNYLIFVGTYVNDTATTAEVERMCQRYKQLRRVEVPHPGPTCKADCLNWITGAIFLHETQSDMEFAGFILHDSEDVVHPLELKFFNYLLPRKDMIQLPVASLERKWYELVAGTYMDEFAEWHGKDMVVRESVSGIVPSAGVGTCFSRRAVLALAEATNNLPFNTNSLTEDYDVGTRLARLGMQSIFAIFPVQYTVNRPSWFGLGKERQLTVDMPLGVREFFPDTFYTAYHQKARWTLGIGLQSWEQIRLEGSFAAKYFLLRDRKGVLTAFISMLAYVLVIQFILFQMAAYFGFWTVRFPSLFAGEGWWDTLLYINTIALLIRAVQRVYFVTRLYGWEHGVMSIPRMLVTNFVNFMAVSRAWKLYLMYLFLGRPLAWDKTMHDFPSAAQLVRQRQRLGDLLKSWQAVDQNKIDSALKEQAKTHIPLGRVLISKGWLDDETVAEAIAYQCGFARAQVDAQLVQEHAREAPVDLCARLGVLYLGLDETQQPVFAVASPLTPIALAQLQTATGAQPVQRIARESEIAAGLRVLVGETGAFSHLSGRAMAAPLIGELLVEHGLVRRETFDSVMKEYCSSKNGRIGDFLVKRGVIQRGAIEQAVQEQRRHQAEMEASAA